MLQFMELQGVRHHLATEQQQQKQQQMNYKRIVIFTQVSLSKDKQYLHLVKSSFLSLFSKILSV